MKSKALKGHYYTEAQLRAQFDKEFSKRTDEIYATIKGDIVNQTVAVMFTTLSQFYGFDTDRLLLLKKDMEQQFQFMLGGGYWKDYSTQTCLDYLKTNFGIDLDKEGNFVKCFMETSATQSEPPSDSCVKTS